MKHLHDESMNRLHKHSGISEPTRRSIEDCIEHIVSSCESDFSPYILSQKDLSGLREIAAEAIDKYRLSGEKQIFSSKALSKREMMILQAACEVAFQKHNIISCENTENKSINFQQGEYQTFFSFVKEHVMDSWHYIKLHEEFTILESEAKDKWNAFLRRFDQKRKRKDDEF